GVKIWEYKPTLLHQKIIVIDGVWFCVGSTNFDDRSFDHNDEISMGVLDRKIAGQLTAEFENDKKKADQRHFEEWKNRGLWHKLIDGVAYLGHGQL
ncbi:MAG: phospholipase D-like domain-containing protein, partial [Acidobacteriota bacterium]